jgi:hypothetical protein
VLLAGMKTVSEMIHLIPNAVANLVQPIGLFKGRIYERIMLAASARSLKIRQMKLIEAFLNASFYFHPSLVV